MGIRVTSVSNSLLAKPAQAVVRGTLMVLDDLFLVGSCLVRIGMETFVVDSKSGQIMLSAAGVVDVLEFDKLQTPHLQVDANISSLADLLEDFIFANNGVSLPAVEVVAFGLFPLIQISDDRLIVIRLMTKKYVFVAEDLL